MIPIKESDMSIVIEAKNVVRLRGIQQKIVK